jgi:hypothetical protein
MIRILALVALFSLSSSLSAWEQTGPHRYEGVERIVAFGDVHGALTEFKSLLVLAGLIDGDGNWTGGQTHLVSVGDLLDRGADSRGVMDLLMALQPQAEAAGGRVHVVLGNHEVMNMSGELEYVLPEEFASYVDLEDPEAEPNPELPQGFAGHRRAMSRTGPYGSWLASLPFAVVVNDNAFMHAGASDMMSGLDLDAVNQRASDELLQMLDLRQQLIEKAFFAEHTPFRQSQLDAKAVMDNPEAPEEDRTLAERFLLLAGDGLPFSAKGPVWYRRSALCHPYTEQQITESILDDLGAERLVIGHTPTKGRTVQSRMAGRVLAIDTGMNVGYYEGHPAAVQIKRDAVAVLYTDIDERSVIAQQNRHWERPYDLDDAGIEDFLAHADVVKVEELSVGITKPRRLTLQRDHQTLRAVFKNMDTDPDIQSGRWKRTHDKADRYQNELVAYRLDRMLGFDLVPPTVLRTVNGEQGAVQYWMEDTITELMRREQAIDYVGYCSPGSQYSLMNVWDVLIHNDDRTLGNVMYTRSDWMLWFIDHTRAFRSDRKPPAYLREARIDISPQLREILEDIDMDRLEPLSDHLHEKQRQGIVARARALLKMD